MRRITWRRGAGGKAGAAGGAGCHRLAGGPSRGASRGGACAEREDCAAAEGDCGALGQASASWPWPSGLRQGGSDSAPGLCGAEVLTTERRLDHHGQPTLARDFSHLHWRLRRAAARPGLSFKPVAQAKQEVWAQSLRARRHSRGRRERTLPGPLVWEELAAGSSEISLSFLGNQQNHK